MLHEAIPNLKPVSICGIDAGSRARGAIPLTNSTMGVTAYSKGLKLAHKIALRIPITTDIQKPTKILTIVANI